MIHAGSPSKPPEGVRLETLVGFGIVKGVGTWTYDATTDDAQLTWPPQGDADLLPVMRARIDEFARVGGGRIIEPADPPRRAASNESNSIPRRRGPDPVRGRGL